MLLFVPKMTRDLCEEHELDKDVGVREDAGLPPEAPLYWSLSDNVESALYLTLTQNRPRQGQGLLFT